MTRNVLSELNVVTRKIVDDGFRDMLDGTRKPFGKLARTTYEKVINYVRDGSWTDNDTAKFVVQNFHIGQANMSDAYSQMYPSKSPKADSTIRTQFQKINKYLQNVFPNYLVEAFINEDEEQLKSLSTLIDALYLNDQRIESSLGEQLIGLLQCLPLSSKKYEVGECKHELEVLKKLSCNHAEDLIESCDISKLAYVYHVLTRPSVIKGELNEARLSYIKAFVDTSVSYSSQVSDLAIGSYECINPIDIIKDYAEGGVVNEDDFINPEVTDCIRSIITQNGIIEQLSRFTKDEVAYALSVISKGDSDFIDAFEEGRSSDIDNCVGSTRLLDGIKPYIEACIESVTTPSEQVPASVLMTIADYTPSVMKERLSSIKAEDLACVYEKLCLDNPQLLSTIHQMSGKVLADYEADRLAIKKDFIQSSM